MSFGPFDDSDEDVLKDKILKENGEWEGRFDSSVGLRLVPKVHFSGSHTVEDEDQLL